MIDFVEYLKNKLNELSDSTYSIGVYDEVNFNFENPEDIIFIFSGNAIIQADYSKKVYTQTYSLSVYTEKDGFDYANNLALELFKNINNTTETIDAYETRIEIESPVVLNVYGTLQNGLTNTLQMTGTLHLSYYTELALDNLYAIGGEEFNPINPAFSVNVNSNTENDGGVGYTYPNYYTYEFSFSMWDDDSVVACGFKDNLQGANNLFDFQIMRGDVRKTNSIPVLTTSEDWIDYFAVRHTNGYAIQNKTGNVFALQRVIAGKGEFVINYNGNELNTDSVNIPNDAYLVLKAREKIEGTNEYIYYCVLTYDYSALNIYMEDCVAIISYVTDTQSGFSTYNVKLVR